MIWKPDLDQLNHLRHKLFEYAEPSGQEDQTSKILIDFLARLNGFHLVENIGGKGLAVVFKGTETGPRILLRSDMDGLPISGGGETHNPNVSHRCGHDGHMTILSGVASFLSQNPPPKGEVILLFQPAEETGEGARWVLDDPKFQALGPLDWVFALHNIPGTELGTILIRDGVFASASTGIQLEFEGRTSHAAEPQLGISPALAVAHMIGYISSLPQFQTALHESAKATLIHADVGERNAFGTSPGKSCIQTTLRAYDTELVNHLRDQISQVGQQVAKAHGLTCNVQEMQPFPSCFNDSQAAGYIRHSAKALNLEVKELEIPFSWSEDFGHFCQASKGALFGLGSGSKQPNLHHPSYEFPDALIETGSDMFIQILLTLWE